MTRARVCIAQAVICSDDFLDLPASARALYACLLLEADNDGALDSLRRIARAYGASQDDIEALTNSGYLLNVGNVCFITDWHVHNTKDKHNYRPGNHQDALSRLALDVNRRYTLSEPHQSDGRLTLAPNTNQYKTSELNATQFNSDVSTSKADFAAQEGAANPLACCPRCGSAELETTQDRLLLCPSCECVVGRSA